MGARDARDALDGYAQNREIVMTSFRTMLTGALAAFGLVAGHLLGNGLAWLSILVAGAVGNWLDAVLQPDQHSRTG